MIFDTEYMERILLKSKEEETLKLDQWLENCFKVYETDTALHFNIQICAHEAFNNAISHGNNFDEEKKIEVLFDYDTDVKAYYVQVNDEGPGFDFNTVVSTADDNISDSDEEKGRGVHFMNQFASSVEYRNNGAAVIMWFYA